MQDLIARSSAEFNLTEQRTRAALSVLLKLIEQHADPRDLALLLTGLPEAEQLLAEAKQGEPRRVGLFRSSGGLAGSLTSAMGGRGSLLATAAELQKHGVGLNQMRPFLTAFAEHAEAKVGRDLVERIAFAIPGLDSLRA